MNVSDGLLRLLVLAVALIFLAACQAPQVLDEGVPARSVGEANAGEADASEYGSVMSVPTADESLYGVPMTWTNQNGNRMELASLAGRPVVLSMVFTNCSYACPLIIRDMKRIGAQLPDDERDAVHYVLVSLDPDRDTPEVLRRFADAYGLDLNCWTLLRGDGEQVRLLSALLGVRYRPQTDGQIAHTSLVTILDEAGEIIHQKKGLRTTDVD